MRVLSNSAKKKYLSLHHLPPAGLPVAELLNQELLLQNLQGARYLERVEGTVQSLCGELPAGTQAVHNAPRANAVSSRAPATLRGHPRHRGWLLLCTFPSRTTCCKRCGFPCLLPRCQYHFQERAQPPPREERRVLMDQLRQNSREDNKRPSDIRLSQLS